MQAEEHDSHAFEVFGKLPTGQLLEQEFMLRKYPVVQLRQVEAVPAHEEHGAVHIKH